MNSNFGCTNRPSSSFSNKRPVSPEGGSPHFDTPRSLSIGSTLSPPFTSSSRPLKIPKIEGFISPGQSSALFGNSPPMSHSYHTPSGSSGWRSSKAPIRGSSNKGKGKATKRAARHTAVIGPVYNAAYIEANYRTAETVPQDWKINPKSALTTYMSVVHQKQPDFSTNSVSVGKESLWRSVLIIPEEQGDIVAYGDHVTKKESEKLAALCALFQLDARGLMAKEQEMRLNKRKAIPGQLSNGATINYERARQFMDYYCRRFGFSRPEVTYNEFKGSSNREWEATMLVDGKRLGMGSGATKKLALYNCFVDVTQYIESCDPALWQRFVEDAKTGKDLGMASTFLFQISDTVADQVQLLCEDISRSALYRNRPRSSTSSASSSNPASAQTASGRYVPPQRRAAAVESIQSKSQTLLQKQKEYAENSQLEKIRAARASLPVYTMSQNILDHIGDNEVTICMAATGSGKTTQVPQLILDEWTSRGEGAKCNIICTQPRRIAAISVANRVAAERGEAVGKSVGYQVRFEAKLPEPDGSITFCTTGIFLKRMHSALETGIDEVTHLIVDEVHERDVDTDLMLVVLKRLLHVRRQQKKPLKVILMSATVDPTLFQQYFADMDGKPVSLIEVPGRTFPVQRHFMDDFVPEILSTPDAGWLLGQESVLNYLAKELDPASVPPSVAPRLRKTDPSAKGEDLEIPYPLIAYTISRVLKSTDDGHVLVFLPGWEEITSMQKALLSRDNPLALSKLPNYSQISVHLLHSSIPVSEQQVIFDPPAKGVRRIILSTNIAETSVTIPDVVYVIDTAKVKEQRYDPERHISSLVSAWVGSSNLHQRAGRAGRHRSGEYFGFLGRKRLAQLHPHQTVEIRRVDLTNVVMHVKALNFPGVATEEVLAALIEPPTESHVTAAMQSLQMVGALDAHKNLTSLGHVLLQLPIDPQMGRLVLYGAFFRCLDEALTLAAIMTNRDPFMSPMHLREEAARCKRSFSPTEFRSDALTILRAYNVWWGLQSRGDSRDANRFCMDNFLSKPTLIMIQKIKAHILRSLYDIGVMRVVARGEVADWQPRSRLDPQVPPELNTNGDSLPLLAALITVASQPKFAIRTSEKSFRTNQDKVVFIHPSSVNHTKHDREIHKMPFTEAGSTPPARAERQIIAFAEKRQNVSMAASSATPQKFLVNTTRVDPLTYILFGAYRVEVTRHGLICDEWLPIVGPVDALDEVERLKALMEASMLRVFEGITQEKSRHASRRPPDSRREGREEESGDEGDDSSLRNSPLTETEIEELDMMTHNIARILNEYSSYRIANQSRNTSRPSTPGGSPTFGVARLSSADGSGGGSSAWPSPLMGSRSSRSGYSTPYNAGNAFMSRPGTPSRLRQW